MEEGSDPAPSPTSSLSILTTPPLESVFGMMTVSGRMPDMEDAVSVKKSLCWPDINRGRPVHFFAVFDGHGGSHVTTLFLRPCLVTVFGIFFLYEKKG